MEIGLIGAGKIGGGILRRLRAAGHTVHVHDVNPAAAAVAQSVGAAYHAEIEALVSALRAPRRLWLMVPAPEVPRVIDELAKRLDSGDIVIDGGNSFFKDSRQHAIRLDKRGIHFIDVGVSGGLAGEKEGYALMAGGDRAHVAAITEILNALAAPQALVHVGPAGAGHFVKMVHNAVEYGMMQAIGEGFDLLKNGPFKDLQLKEVAQLWSRGTIVRSFLMELAAKALQNDEALAEIAAYVEDSGEGRWATATAVEHSVPFGVNTAALYARFDSRIDDSFSAKLVAALRKEFGGHATKRKGD